MNILTAHDQEWEQELSPYDQYEEERTPNLESVFEEFMAYHAISKANQNSMKNHEIHFGRHILAERKVEIYHTELDEFKAELERRNFHKRLTNLADNNINLALVKEFYANLYSPEGPSPKQVRIRGHLIKIDADNLNTFLETPVVLADGESLPAYSKYCKMPIDIREIEAALCIPGQGFVLNAEGYPGKILRKDLTTLAQVWSVLSYSNLAPTSHTSDLTLDRARLGFPALIAALCRSKGVASNSLVFEHLSPVINLACIRKNCWNPADLTVTIRGARRARTRPAEAPSTSVAPPPAPWPGTQPPLHREDEGLTAQVPQQREDESSKTSTPKPLIRRKRVVETQEAATTSEKSLEATSEPSEPVADTTSIHQVADPSTPEDQTTPVLSPNTSPPD
ncbi:hypothetical protein HKD37_16G045110 [Glycine soja]